MLGWAGVGAGNCPLPIRGVGYHPGRFWDFICKILQCSPFWPDNGPFWSPIYYRTLFGDSDKFTQSCYRRLADDGPTDRPRYTLHFYNSRRHLKAKSPANAEKPREHTVTWGQFVITRLIYFSRQPVHKIWRFYLHPFQRNLRGVKFWNWSCNPGHAPFSDGRSSEG